MSKQSSALRFLRKKHPEILLDPEDFEELKNCQAWFGSHGYVVINYKGKPELLHKVILGLDLEFVDHKNRNKLNYLRDNLRAATRDQNNQNVGVQSNNTSGYKGVSWAKARNKWRAAICVNRINRHIGFYLTKEEAAIAYNEAAKLHHGEFAFLNVVKDDTQNN